jgi:8-oxo-dGTP pyrophosphatase MutT (NUDIX family)
VTAAPPFLDRFLAEAPTMVVPPMLRPPAEGARAAAVLVLFGDGVNGPDLLLIQRADTLRKHPGQPAFPGGAIDPEDDGPVAAALREAAEETGVDPAGVEVLTTLPELYLSHSDFLVTPVVAWWREPSEVGAVDPGEVASVARVSIADLTDPANRLLLRGPAGSIGPAFQVEGMLVWGFTAGLLNGLLAVGGWERPWNTGRVEDLPASVLDLAVRS